MDSFFKDTVIAFDLDGTLVDTAPDLLGTLNLILEEEGLSPLPMSKGRHLIGKGARKLLLRGFEACGVSLDDRGLESRFTKFLDIYRQRLVKESLPFENCLETLKDLCEQGARLVVCTNKSTDLSVQILTALGMTPYFVAIVGADISPAPKPDPRHLLQALSLAEADLQKSVMVGDSENDVLAAKALGIPSLVFPFGYTDIAPENLGADRLVPDYLALPAAIRTLLQKV